MHAPITLEVLKDPNRPKAQAAEVSTDADGWEHYAWRVKLVRDRDAIEVEWKSGTAHSEWARYGQQGEFRRAIPPTVADVLESILSDAAAYENARSFEEWALEYGYDTDSRKAESIYQAVAEQTKQLRWLLGPDFHAAVFPPAGLDPEQVAERLASGRELTPDNDEEG